LAQIVEQDLPRAIVAVSGAIDRGLDSRWTAKFLRPARQVQGMESVTINRTGFFGLGLHVDRPGIGVDYRRACDAYFRNDVS